MTKILQATCVGGIVMIEDIPVPIAEILSEGVGPSSGVVTMEGDTATYLTSNASDIKTALTQISTALTNIASALILIDAKPLGTLPAAPAAAANIALVTAAQAQIAALKEVLK